MRHHPAKFGAHRHCGSGDIMSLVAEEEGSKCSWFSLSLLFIFKGHRLEAHHINNSVPGHTRLKKQLGKSLKMTFPSPFKNYVEKKKESKIFMMT